jgi:hypothetical protein
MYFLEAGSRTSRILPVYMLPYFLAAQKPLTQRYNGLVFTCNRLLTYMTNDIDRDDSPLYRHSRMQLESNLHYVIQYLDTTNALTTDMFWGVYEVEVYAKRVRELTDACIARSEELEDCQKQLQSQLDANQQILERLQQQGLVLTRLLDDAGDRMADESQHNDEAVPLPATNPAPPSLPPSLPSLPNFPHVDEDEDDFLEELIPLSTLLRPPTSPPARPLPPLPSASLSSFLSSPSSSSSSSPVTVSSPSSST